MVLFTLLCIEYLNVYGIFIGMSPYTEISKISINCFDIGLSAEARTYSVPEALNWLSLTQYLVILLNYFSNQQSFQIFCRALLLYQLRSEAERIWEQSAERPRQSSSTAVLYDILT